MNLQLETIHSRRRLRKALWIKACRYDNVNIAEKFVVFSDNNPHIERLNSLGIVK